ncbi:MAG: hypothetical protein GY849_09025 [Deltaproteobacteria bacterium]|nr:hypothetical protein [Deltaproteobacteria bacterium]
MPDTKKTIRIKVKLFTGLGNHRGVEGQNPRDGITMDVPRGARLKKVVKELDLPDRHSLAYFVNGERAGLWKKLQDGHEVACLKPSAGG